MKKIVSFAARAAFATMLLAASGMAAAEVTPDEALLKLKEGNAAFAAGFTPGNSGNTTPNPTDFPNLRANSTPQARAVVAGGQHPYAIVLDCADSRVSPEIIFDKGLGELFVVRVAGNVVAPHELGSIEYAVEHLGAHLIVVLGHSKCGAVNATVGSLKPGTCVVSVPRGNIGSLVESIAPAVEHACHQHPADLLAASIDENVHTVEENILHKSAIVEEAVRMGHAKIVKGVYDLQDGLVHWME